MVSIPLSNDVKDLLQRTSNNAQVWRSSACTYELHNILMPDFPANKQKFSAKQTDTEGYPHHSLVKKVDHHIYKILSLQEWALDKSGPLHVKRY